MHMVTMPISSSKDLYTGPRRDLQQVRLLLQRELYLTVEPGRRGGLVQVDTRARLPPALEGHAALREPGKD